MITDNSDPQAVAIPIGNKLAGNSLDVRYTPGILTSKIEVMLCRKDEMHTGKYAVKDITSQILTSHCLHHFICCKKSYYGLRNKLDHDGYDYAKSYCDHQCIAKGCPGPIIFSSTNILSTEC